MPRPGGISDHLAEHTGGLYTVTEKILEADETLSETWPVAGTSGYDFLNRGEQSVCRAGWHEQAMSRCYVDFSGQTASYPEVVYRAKQQVMTTELGAEVERLVGILVHICHQASSASGSPSPPPS